MNTSIPAAETAISDCLARYVASIIHADDPSLAQGVWAATPAVTLIHPRGHEHGWEEVRANFYEKTMAAKFSKRELKVMGAPVIRVYGDTAVVEFEWDFVATRREDDGALRNQGRESQVYINTPDAGWRLMHVHYSRLPGAD